MKSFFHIVQLFKSPIYPHDLTYDDQKELAADPAKLFRATIAQQIKLMHKYKQLIKLLDNSTNVR